MGADKVIAADAAFVRAIRTHPDRTIAKMVVPLSVWDSR